MVNVLNYALPCELRGNALPYEISTYLCQMNTIVKLFYENLVDMLNFMNSVVTM